MAAPRVLIVDDEPDLLEVCARALRNHDLEAITASDAETAQMLLRAHAVDLLVTDVRMPTENGISLLQTVHDTIPDLPLMIVTGYPDSLAIDAALDLNVKSFLVKPFDLVEFVSEVKRSLELHTTIPQEELESERNELISLVVGELRQHKIPVLEGRIQRDPTDGRVVLIPTDPKGAVPIGEFLTDYARGERIYLIVLPHA